MKKKSNKIREKINKKEKESGKGKKKGKMSVVLTLYFSKTLKGSRKQ